MQASEDEAKKNGVNMMLQNMYNSVYGSTANMNPVQGTVRKVTDPEQIKKLYNR